MGNKGFTHLFILFAFFIGTALSACQKDDAVSNPSPTGVTKDSSVVSSRVIFFAAAATLKKKYNDSVYTFDAARDSIAFINVNGADQSRYFGITAINKEHTLSFGVSSAGFAYSNITRTIAGSQLLFGNDALKPAMQFSLTRNSTPGDIGNISMIQYKAGNELAKGTFYAFLSLDDKANSPYYRVEGSFDLQLK
jgi:hypothetical protein